jgi:hypothetical protein
MCFSPSSVDFEQFEQNSLLSINLSLIFIGDLATAEMQILANFHPKLYKKSYTVEPVHVMVYS